MVTVEQLKTDYDWSEVLGYGKELEEAEPGSKVDCSGFTVDDVSKIIASAKRGRDDEDWVIVLQLKDKRFVTIRAGCHYTGCDYTGWDCQQWGNANVAKTKAKAICFGLSNSERDRLGISQPDQVGV